MKLIVGIDPGVVTAISLIDLKLDFVEVKSKRNFSKDEIIEFITEKGEPIIMSCDVHRPPQIAKKLASIFNAKLITPNKSMSLKKKNRLVRRCKQRIKNRHERDALASAIFAFQKVRPLFNKVDKLVDEKELSDEIKAIIIKNKIGNIKQVIKRFK
ncbi:MAG: DUF460 domain-containing protein [Candidatus Aenigmatarchaeota archaeon]